MLWKVYFYFRTILTSAHTICTHANNNDEDESTDPPYFCAPNEESSGAPTNQIIDGQRKIFFIAGRKTIDRRSHTTTENMESTLNSPDHIAEEAYILQTKTDQKGDVMLLGSGRMDIGIIIVKNVSTLPTAPNIAFLKLPTDQNMYA